MSKAAWIENLAFNDEAMAREGNLRELYVRALALPFAEGVIRSVKDGLGIADAVLSEDCALTERADGKNGNS